MIAKEIKKARQLAGLTQKQLAEKVGATKAYISNIENGKQTLSSTKIEEIAAVLNHTLIQKLIPKNERSKSK